MFSEITIEDLALNASIGIHDHEKQDLQKIYVSLKFQVDIQKVAKSDDIRDALDYSRVADEVRTIVFSKHFNLIEHLAYVIAEQLKEKFDLKTVVVKIRKPEAIKTAKWVEFHLSV